MQPQGGQLLCSSFPCVAAGVSKKQIKKREETQKVLRKKCIKTAHSKKIACGYSAHPALPEHLQQTGVRCCSVQVPALGSSCKFTSADSGTELTPCEAGDAPSLRLLDTAPACWEGTSTAPSGHPNMGTGYVLFCIFLCVFPFPCTTQARGQLMWAPGEMSSVRHKGLELRG